MEIRLLTNSEIGSAVEVANRVFDNCVLPSLTEQIEVQQFRNYANAEHLWVEACKLQLFFWGSFENGQMTAVSAMTHTGRITMLYVMPERQKQGNATQLLLAMERYAAEVLKCREVTINVTPVKAMGFFQANGFTETGIRVSSSFCPMQFTLYDNNGNLRITQQPESQMNTGYTNAQYINTQNQNIQNQNTQNQNTQNQNIQNQNTQNQNIQNQNAQNQNIQYQNIQNQNAQNTQGNYGQTNCQIDQAQQNVQNNRNVGQPKKKKSPILAIAIACMALVGLRTNKTTCYAGVSPVSLD